mmetsp:Transcript_65892/g.122998  ORF Transcript_65892/g.122998 Transcript_65892/m.122998 type:complete len:753 (-) Transcript_65892:85-2343(-)
MTMAGLQASLRGGGSFWTALFSSILLALLFVPETLAVRPSFDKELEDHQKHMRVDPMVESKPDPSLLELGRGDDDGDKVSTDEHVKEDDIEIEISSLPEDTDDHIPPTEVDLDLKTFPFNFAYVRHGKSFGNGGKWEYGDGRLMPKGEADAQAAADAVWEEHLMAKPVPFSSMHSLVDDVLMPPDYSQISIASFLVMGNRDDGGNSKLEVWVSPLRRAIATAIIFYSRLLGHHWVASGKGDLPKLPRFRIKPKLQEKYKTRSEVVGVRTGSDDPKKPEDKLQFTTPAYIEQITSQCAKAYFEHTTGGTGPLKPIADMLTSSWLHWEHRTRGQDESGEGPDYAGLNGYNLYTENPDDPTTPLSLEPKPAPGPGTEERAWMLYLPTTIERFMENIRDTKKEMIAAGVPILLVAHSGWARFAFSGKNGLADPRWEEVGGWWGWLAEDMEERIKAFGHVGRWVCKLANGGLLTGTVYKTDVLDPYLIGTDSAEDEDVKYLPASKFRYGRGPRMTDVSPIVGERFENFHEDKDETKERDDGLKGWEKQFAMFGWDHNSIHPDEKENLLPPGAEWRRFRVMKKKTKGYGKFSRQRTKERIMTIAWRPMWLDYDRPPVPSTDDLTISTEETVEVVRKPAHDYYAHISFLSATERSVTTMKRYQESVRNDRDWAKPTKGRLLNVAHCQLKRVESGSGDLLLNVFDRTEGTGWTDTDIVEQYTLWEQTGIYSPGYLVEEEGSQATALKNYFDTVYAKVRET